MTITLDYLIPEFKNHIAIVANGEFPSSELVLNWLQQRQLLIACDGALNNLQQRQIIADFAIGDGDSHNKLASAGLRNPFIEIKDQNSNDLSKAAAWVAGNYGCDIPLIIYAASGRRDDHALANIALLQQYAECFSQIIMLNDYGIWRPLNCGSNIIRTLIGQQLSFFGLNPSLRLSCQQLKWPLTEFKFEFLNSGTLNQCTANYIEVKANSPALLYLTFEIKPA